MSNIYKTNWFVKYVNNDSPKGRLPSSTTVTCPSGGQLYTIRSSNNKINETGLSYSFSMKERLVNIPGGSFSILLEDKSLQQN